MNANNKTYILRRWLILLNRVVSAVYAILGLFVVVTISIDVLMEHHLRFLIVAVIFFVMSYGHYKIKGWALGLSATAFCVLTYSMIFVFSSGYGVDGENDRSFIENLMIYLPFPTLMIVLLLNYYFYERIIKNEQIPGATIRLRRVLENCIKTVSLIVGLVALLFGAVHFHIPDWDIGVSLVMAFATLATAEWSISVIWEKRLKFLPLAIFWTWLSVDGVYWAYWSAVKPEVMVRGGQWLVSLCLYLLCGVIWYKLVPIMADTLIAVGRKYASFIKSPRRG